MRRWIAACPAAALLALAGCADSTGPADALGREDAALVALESDAAVGVLIELALADFPVGASGPAVALFDVRPFERSRACPQGGQITVSGEVERTRSGDGVVEWTVTGSGAWEDCAHARGDRVVTVTGTFSFEAYRKRVNGQFVGPQTTHKAGSFTWVSGDRSGECTFDLTSVRNPDADRRTVTGTMCGRSIDRSVTWSRSG